MDAKDIIYAFGIMFTFAIGVANLFILIRNNKKNVFINAITTSRIKYIQEIRNCISEFCGLIYSYNNRLSSIDDKSLFELHKQADRIKYLIQLYLNPEDKFWDCNIISLIDEIIELSDKNPKDKIEELIILTQYLLKLEWEGAKLESEKGLLNRKEKKSLCKKYEKLYKSYIENSNS